MLRVRFTHHLPGLVTLGLSACVAASVVYWALHWPAHEVGAGPVALPVEPPVPIDAQAVARALGGGMVASTAGAVALGAVAPRLRLLGVVADRQGVGAALIAVAGQPVRSYRVGSRVTDDLLVQSVGPRQAVLAATLTGPAALTLEMPAPPAAALAPKP